MMKSLVATKLDWALLTKTLADFAYTDEGKERLLSLEADLEVEAILASWEQTEEVLRVEKDGLRVPLGEIRKLKPYFKLCERGGALDGGEFVEIARLLRISRNIKNFSRACRSTNPMFDDLYRQIFEATDLLVAIDSALDGEGKIKDDASPLLTKIRMRKSRLRKDIEIKIKALFHNSDLTPYAQDDFFTVRSDRYVVPIRTDGKGRVKGSVYDTSDSGQTLYIEPAVIAPLNEELMELELEEKLEILRIFQQLRDRLLNCIEEVKVNYDLIISLDEVVAKARLARMIDAVRVRISEQPLLSLISARHPLLAIRSRLVPTGDEPHAQDYVKPSPLIANDVSLESTQKGLILSGPNAGGKTVLIKTIGLIHLMAKAGLLLPVDERSEIFIPDNVFLELGDAQDMHADLSTFSGHLYNLKPILQEASPRDIVLLDELCSGTDPQTGASIAQAMLEHLVSQQAQVVVATHFDPLKVLALDHPHLFRNGSMEYDKQSLKPTYRLILDTPGQSYGFELCESVGISKSILDRAQKLRGEEKTQLESVIRQLSQERSTVIELKERLKLESMELQQAKEQWELTKEAFKKEKKSIVEQLTQRFESIYEEMKEDYYGSIDQLKETVKKLQSQNKSFDEEQKQTVQVIKDQSRDVLKKLASSFQSIKEQYDSPPEGETLESFPKSQIRKGMKVRVKSLQKDGVIENPKSDSRGNYSVRVGSLVVDVHARHLIVIETKKKIEDVAGPATSQPPSPLSKKAMPVGARVDPDSESAIPFTPSSSLNSIDIRGYDAEDAVEKALKFIDASLLRGHKTIVLIHGLPVLRDAIRKMLKETCPYVVRFRAGDENEGGDGVTIVAL